MADKPKKYCDGIDCAFCSEKEPCIYKIANRLESELYQLKAENERLKKEFEDIAEARIEMCNQCGRRDDYNIPCKQIRDLDYDLQLEIEENEKLKQTIEILQKENEVLKQRIIEIDRSYKNRQEELEQTLTEIKEIAEKQVPYINLDQVKTCTEVEYDYVGKIWNLEQRMYNILQKIAECEVENDNA